MGEATHLKCLHPSWWTISIMEDTAFNGGIGPLKSLFPTDSSTGSRTQCFARLYLPDFDQVLRSTGISHQLKLTAKNNQQPNLKIANTRELQKVKTTLRMQVNGRCVKACVPMFPRENLSHVWRIQTSRNQLQPVHFMICHPMSNG